MNTSEIIGPEEWQEAMARIREDGNNSPDELLDAPQVEITCKFPSGCGAKSWPGLSMCYEHSAKLDMAQALTNVAEDLRLERENVQDQAETIKHLEKVRSQLIELGKESTAEIARLEAYRPFQNACTFILGAGAVACFAILLVQVLHG